MPAEYTTCDILNLVPDFKNWSYIELGVGNNYNFEAIKCASKMSVDIEKNATWTGTTDEMWHEKKVSSLFSNKAKFKKSKLEIVALKDNTMFTDSMKAFITKQKDWLL